MVDIADSNDLAKLAQKRQQARKGNAPADIAQAPVPSRVDPKVTEEQLKSLEESLITETLLNKKRSEEVKKRQDQIDREQEKEREEKKSRMQMARPGMGRPGQYRPPLRSTLGQRLTTPSQVSSPHIPAVPKAFSFPDKTTHMVDELRSQSAHSPASESPGVENPSPISNNEPEIDKKIVTDNATRDQSDSQVSKAPDGNIYAKLLEEQEFNIFQRPKTAEKEPGSEVIHASPRSSVNKQTASHTPHVMTRNDKLKFLVIRSIGNFLLLLSLYGVFATFGPAVYFEATYRLSQAKGIEYRVAVNPVSVSGQQGIQENQPQPRLNRGQQQTVGPSLGSILAGNKEQILVPPDTQFSIIIPKIGASSRVLPNIDPNNESEFLSALKEGVAHAKGTVFPGYPGNTYLFAHSTDNWWNVGRYNAVFYLLKDLQSGDEVIIFFENKRYNYVITRSLITDPSDTQYLVNNRGDEQQLILQTCWPPGTTWKRILVFAKLKSEVR